MSRRQSRPATGRTVIDLLFDLHETSGTTLVLITHDPLLAARCRRIVQVEDGRIAASRAQIAEAVS